MICLEIQECRSQCTRHLRPLPHRQMLRNTRRMVIEDLCDWRRVSRVSRRAMLTAGHRFRPGEVQSGVEISFEIKYLQNKIKLAGKAAGA